MTINSIVVLTGAGISAESGIETFRASKGGGASALWEQYPVEQVATPEGFAANPALVHEFYNARRAALSVVSPNAAHHALAALEERLTARGGQMMVITQNVDNLHSQAGSKNVVHIHGDLLHMICTNCPARTPWSGDCAPDVLCPSCAKPGTLRPDIVWFGEIPYHMDVIERAVKSCDLFVSIGTSGAVYPAAGLVRLARAHGAQTLELNLDPSDGSHFFHEARQGKAGDLVPQWAKGLAV